MVNGVWRSFSVETPVSLKRKRYLEQQVDSSVGVSIEAPMPGKIIDILVEEGSEVKEGEPIIIGQKFEIESQVLDETRPLLIGLPNDYETSEKAYPVLYLLDGSGHFHHSA